VWLSIDWDWVTGDTATGGCCGWSCGSHIDSRGDRSQLNRDWKQRLTRLKRLCAKLKFVKVIVAECHASIYRWLSHGDRIINVDEHSDCYDYMGTDRLSCGNWGLLAQEKKDCTWQWVSQGDRLPSVRHMKKSVSCFVCLSSPWTPKELDGAFVQFVYGLNGPLRLYGHRKRWLEGMFKRRSV